MFVDDTTGTLYMGQEQVGWWATSVAKPSANLKLVDRVRELGVPYAVRVRLLSRPRLGSPYLTADVEGLTIYKSGPGTGYLLVSSQGSNEFLVYDRKTLAHIGNFLVADGIVESVEESDGLHGFASTSSRLAHEWHRDFAMPFKSQAQRRKFAQLLVEGKISNQTFEEWNRETGGKRLPERVRGNAKASRKRTRKTARKTARSAR